MSLAADNSSSSRDWNSGLSYSTAAVRNAWLSLDGDGTMSDFIHTLRDLQRYIRSASHREASSTLESVLAAVLGPILHALHQQEATQRAVEEILEIIVILGQGCADIIALMREQGIFHLLTTMLMYPSTFERTAACLGRLAGTSDSAGRNAQMAFLAGGVAWTADASAPESSAMAAARLLQVSPLPVVYKLLTAQDQGASTAAVQMLTFLCQMGSQRQRQEQLALAKFGNGVILDIVVQRIKKLCSQTKPSTAKAAELTSLLHLLSSATSECEVAQSKVEEYHILQYLVALLFPIDKRIKLLGIASGDSGVLTKTEPDLELPREQMIEVLGAITSLVGQHALNQALLFSLAEPLTQALAAWLPTFPCTLHTDIPEASLPEAPARSQSHLAAVKNSRTDDKSHRPAINSAAKDSAEKAKQLATSVLTSRLKGSKEASLLTAQLKGGIPVPVNADTQQQSSRTNTCGLSQGSASRWRGERSKRCEHGEVQLARRLVYHVLLHLPADVLKDRMAFWMEHAVGLPEPMQSCLGVAIAQASGAVKSLWQMLHLWVQRPSRCSEEALHRLSNIPALVQGLVQVWVKAGGTESLHTLPVLPEGISQFVGLPFIDRAPPGPSCLPKTVFRAMCAEGLNRHVFWSKLVLVQSVSGEAATEAFKTLSLLSQQEPGAGVLLGAAGAAETIVAAALAGTDTAAFKTTEELSELVLRALPDMDAAVRIVHRCTAAIMGLSSSAIRDRAIGIVTAMSDVLHGAPPRQHDASEKAFGQSHYDVPAVKPVAVALYATDARVGASDHGASVSDCPRDRGTTPPTALTASGHNSASRLQSMEQAVAMETMNVAGASAAQPRQVPALPRTDQQPCKGLPSLALSRPSRKTVKPSASRGTALLQSQQAAALTMQVPHTKAQETQSRPNPAAVDKAAAATVQVHQEGLPEKTHDEVQCNPASTDVEGAALFQAMSSVSTRHNTSRVGAAAIAAAMAPATAEPTAAATAGRTLLAIADASSSRQHDHQNMESMPQALSAREGAQLQAAQATVDNELPRFHSLSSCYGSEHHVREVQEPTDCRRQVGFAVAVPAVRQKALWRRLAFKMVLAIGGVMLAHGFARGIRPSCKQSAQEDIVMDESSDVEDSTDDEC